MGVSNSQGVLSKQSRPNNRVKVMAPVLNKRYTNIVLERQGYVQQVVQKDQGSGLTPLDKRLDHTFELSDNNQASTIQRATKVTQLNSSTITQNGMLGKKVNPPQLMISGNKEDSIRSWIKNPVPL